MAEEIDIQEIKTQYPEFFRNFSGKLLGVVLSKETPLEITKICLKNGVTEEEKIEDIVYHTTSVLLGRLPIKVLPLALQTNSKIDRETAEKISGEISQIIFSPVKNDLAELYKNATSIKSADEPQTPAAASGEFLKRSSQKDAYREKTE